TGRASSLRSSPRGLSRATAPASPRLRGEAPRVPSPHAITPGCREGREVTATAPDIAVPAAADVAVVGAGVIGLSIAWRLALRGLSVAVFERATAGAGASLAATGMLAAAAEHEPGCHDLLALALESQRQWPLFRVSLEAQSGRDTDFRESGTLVVALSRDERE